MFRDFSQIFLQIPVSYTHLHSRYVDTFEEEEPVDIPAVKQEIKELEEKKAGIKAELEALFQELGV